MTEKRKNFKIENKKLIEPITKNCSNAEYGGCIRKDIEEFYTV